MSVEAYNAVWNHFEGSDRQFVLALASANRADEHGILWTSTKWYIEKTRWPRSKVYEVLAELDKADKLVVIESARGRGHVTIRWLKLPGLDGDLTEAEEVLRKKGLISRTLSGEAEEETEKGPRSRTQSQEKGSESSDEKGPSPRTKRVRDLGRPYIEETSVDTSGETSCVAEHTAPIVAAAIMAPLRQVTEAKGAVLDEAAVARACDAYGDRDLVEEAEKFAAWHLHGTGANVPLRVVAPGFRNWLKRAPATAPAKRTSPRPSSTAPVETEKATIAWDAGKKFLADGIRAGFYRNYIEPLEVVGEREGRLVLLDTSAAGGGKHAISKIRATVLEAVGEFDDIEVVDETQLEYEAL
jgi:hypothetical protein